MRRILIACVSMLTTAPAFGFSPKAAAANKGKILFSAAALKGDGAEATLKAVPCHKDTSGKTMATFHVTAFPSKPPTGSVTLKFNDASRTLTAPGKTIVETGVQLTTDDAQGPKLAVVLLEGTTTLAAATIDASCLKPSAAPAKK